MPSSLSSSPPSEVSVESSRAPSKHATNQQVKKSKTSKKYQKSAESAHDMPNCQQSGIKRCSPVYQHEQANTDFVPKKESFDKVAPSHLMFLNQRFFNGQQNPQHQHQQQMMQQFPLPLNTNTFYQHPQNNQNMPSEQAAAAKVFQDYISSTIANLKQNNTFNTLLKHISDISNKNRAASSTPTGDMFNPQTKNLYECILGQQQQSQRLGSQSASTSVLSSSSSSSSTTSSHYFGNTTSEQHQVKLEKKSSQSEFTSDEITDSPEDLDNFSHEDNYSNEDYEEHLIKDECTEDELYMSYKGSKTSTPCSENCSPALSISSVISNELPLSSKPKIKFSIDNILGGSSIAGKSDCSRSAELKRKYKHEPQSPLSDDGDDEDGCSDHSDVKRSKSSSD